MKPAALRKSLMAALRAKAVIVETFHEHCKSEKPSTSRGRLRNTSLRRALAKNSGQPCEELLKPYLLLDILTRHNAKLYQLTGSGLHVRGRFRSEGPRKSAERPAELGHKGRLDLVSRRGYAPSVPLMLALLRDFELFFPLYSVRWQTSRGRFACSWRKRTRAQDFCALCPANLGAGCTAGFVGPPSACPVQKRVRHMVNVGFAGGLLPAPQLLARIEAAERPT
jgi:hypothetical protein